MSRLHTLSLILVLLGSTVGFTCAQQMQNCAWSIPISARIVEELGSGSSDLIIGVKPEATNGFDPKLDLIQPQGGDVFIASYHLKSEPGYTSIVGERATIDLQKDFQFPIRPGEDRIWKLKVRYNGMLPQVTIRLVWLILDNLPPNLSPRIGLPPDFLHGGSGGVEMRQSQTGFDVRAGRFSDNVVEIHVTDTAPSAPFLCITPSSAEVQVGGRVAFTALEQNADSPRWTAPAGGFIEPSGSRAVFSAATPGTYTVRAEVTGSHGEVVFTTATVTVLTPGDLTGDGVVDGLDLNVALDLFLGVRAPTERELAAGDVRPKPGVGGRLYGDGLILADDLNWLLRRFLGLVDTP